MHSPCWVCLTTLEVTELMNLHVHVNIYVGVFFNSRLIVHVSSHRLSMDFKNVEEEFMQGLNPI